MEIISRQIPKPFRTTVSAMGDRLEAAFVNEWSWFNFVSGPIWLAFWAGGLRVASTEFWAKGVQNKDLFSIAFMTVWTAGWAWGGLMVLIGWLGNFNSKEYLFVDSSLIRYRREVLGIGYETKFESKKVRNLRYMPSKKQGRALLPNGLGFEYGGRNKRLLRPLTEPEIESVICAIKAHFPRLGENT